jgi:hypothetical protein
MSLGFQLSLLFFGGAIQLSLETFEKHLKFSIIFDKNISQ